MAFINGQEILFSARVTGGKAIIHCETGLPTTDIDTTSFYEFEGSIYWYDDEWHVLGEGSSDSDATVDRVKYIDTSTGNFSALANEDDGIAWGQDFIMYDETLTRPLTSGGIHSKIPLARGRCVSFEIDEANKVVKVNADTPYSALHDKPFYVKGTISETIDTDLSGGHRIEFNELWTAYQASEKTYTKEQLLGGTVTSTYNTWTIDSSHIAEDTADGLCLHFEGTIDGYVWVAYTTNYQPEGFDAPLPAVGVYWSSYTSAGGEETVSVNRIDLELEDIEHLDNKFLDLLNNRDFKTLKARVDADATIIDVTSLPTDNINEDVFYRLLTGSVVYNQYVQNAYTVHCVETLPEVGEPATNITQTQGNIYFNLQDGNAYGYVDDTLSFALNVPKGWYTADVLINALGLEYKGIITDILDDPRDSALRLLLEYVIWQCKGGKWNSLKPIGWEGDGRSAEIFNHPSNKAYGVVSHAEGRFTVAGVEGEETYGQHAEGFQTRALGEAAHAEGRDTEANGDYSHSEGLGTFASYRAQHVQGRYNNIEDTQNKYAHIVGNGTAPSARSNAHTVDWNGNAWFAGNVYVGGIGQDDETAQKLVTEKELEDSATLDKVAALDTWYGDFESVEAVEDGIIWAQTYAMQDADDSVLSEGGISQKIPLVAGEGVSFDVDEEKQVIRVNGKTLNFKLHKIKRGETFEITPGMMALILPYGDYTLSAHKSDGTTIVSNMGATVVMATEWGADAEIPNSYWVAFLHVKKATIMPTMGSNHNAYTSNCYIKNNYSDTTGSGVAYVYYLS